MKENITAMVTGLIGLFLGGLLVHVAWNAIAWAWNLPQFDYLVCVCAIGALGAICKQLGKIFHDK